MKAMRYHGYGDSGVLVHEETGRPSAGPGQVVIRVAGTAFNPVDAVIRAGVLPEVFPVTFPHTPNYDVAGVVTEVGEGVAGWSPGDAVVGFLPMNAPGAAAEYVAAPADVLAAAPRTVDLADAAALPSVALTARQALFEDGGLAEGAGPDGGRRVLVNGAGGAVGGYAVQLAARAGASVTATASPRSRDRVRSYGAARIVDHTVAPVAEALAGERFDVVLNLVTTDPGETAALVDLVADGGTFASTTTPGPDDAGRGVRTARVFVRTDAARLAELVGLVDAGELTVDVAERLPLADLASVHDRAAAGRLAGRTVLVP